MQSSNGKNQVESNLNRIESFSSLANYPSRAAR